MIYKQDGMYGTGSRSRRCKYKMKGNWFSGKESMDRVQGKKGIFFFRLETEAADVQLPLKLWIRLFRSIGEINPVNYGRENLIQIMFQLHFSIIMLSITSLFSQTEEKAIGGAKI